MTSLIGMDGKLKLNLDQYFRISLCVAVKKLSNAPPNLYLKSRVKELYFYLV